MLVLQKIEFMGFFSKHKKQDKSKTTDTIEAIIKDVENTPYGIADTNVLFAGFDEIGGYYLLKTIIIGDFDIKTKRGAKIELESTTDNFSFSSDTLEFESQPTSIKGRQMTFIDFEIEESDMLAVKKSEITGIKIQLKKTTFSFKRFKEKG